MKKQEQQTLVIDINLTRGLVALLIGGLLIVAALAFLGWAQDEVSASGEQKPLAASGDMRQYYLTNNEYLGDVADNACGDGYHMASLWEIVDPSNLKYNTALGYKLNDSGQGPPASVISATGWIRTGYSITNTSTTPGQPSCNGWASNNSIDRGTVANLADDWTSGGGAQDIHVWNVDAPTCDWPYRVWCVED